MKKLLVVVDFQNDFVDGALGFPSALPLADRIAEKIRFYESQGDDVIFTMDTHGEDYLDTQEGKYLPVPHCVKGTTGWELFGPVKDLAGSHLMLEKVTFGSEALFDYLREHPYEQIELVGLVSNICLLANVILAKTAQPETPIWVDYQCTASFDQEINEKTFAVMKGLQVQISHEPN